jgi:uncharacterized protein involved in response to NO
LEWHIHELLYGFLPAIVAGFLLTAVPNWTGRLPVTGRPLLILFLIWVSGRVAILTSALTGLWFAAIVDLAFLAAMIGLIARELIAGSNVKNARVLLLVGVLFVGNAIFQLEAALGFGEGYGTRTGVAAAVLLIMLIGGRIIPSFTRNWLAKRVPGRLPISFGGFDVFVIVAGAIALASWIAMPDSTWTAGLLMIAGVVHTIRLARWAGERTAPELLLLVLHAGYAFVPVGFFLVALAIAGPNIVPPSGALHAWTVGAIGLMTLGVMTRASLGHTGRPVTATRLIALIYAAVLVAAMARLVAAFEIAPTPMLQASAIAWVIAFGGFAVIYWPVLTGAKKLEA